MNGLPPNPTVWKPHPVPDGRFYYYNTVTRETTWNKPDELMTPLERALASQPWKEHASPDGRTYYSHTETKKTQWEMPTEYREALDSLQQAPKSLPAAPAFVAGGSTALTSYESNPWEGRDSSRKPEITLPAIQKEVIPDYSSFEEAENAFLKLLRRSNVQPDWTWEQTMRATIRDPQYRALKDPKDRKAAFERYAVEVRQQEKERAKERLAKLRTDFGNMLRTHPEIKHLSRWKTIRPIIERETVFRAAENEDERKQLFEEYIIELKKQNIEQEASRRKSALLDLTNIMKALNLEPYTRWAQAQDILQSNERVQSDENFKLLSKSDVLTAFENHIKSLERNFNDARQQHKASRTRLERQNRAHFADLLLELRSQGKIKAGTKWMTVLPLLEEDPRYVGMLGQAGSTPLDMFWDTMEEEERALRGRRNDAYDVLEDKRYEVTSKTTFAEFFDIMLTDRRTASTDKEALELIFQRLHDKVLKRSDDEKHAADRHQRRAIDSLRSRIKHLEPPIRIADSWEDTIPLIEKTDEYRALDSDDLRKSAFDKVIKRLKEKEEDAGRERDRRRARRSDGERDQRNGHKESRHSRLSRSPEPDAYEADRRKAIATRERQYRKTNPMSLTPPPDTYRGDRDRDRRRPDDRHGRLVDRSSPSARVYDRDGHDRDDERDRLYRARADPRSSRDELNYGEDAKSASGTSERRRRRGAESDGESVEGGRKSSKRYRAGSRDERERVRDVGIGGRRRERTKTPEVKEVKKEIKKEEVDLSGVHSGSEEGEIEED